jgi:hypothetical protein
MGFAQVVFFRVNKAGITGSDPDKYFDPDKYLLLKQNRFKKLHFHLLKPTFQG